jgi:rRNA-processing protein FCF1
VYSLSDIEKYRKTFGVCDLIIDTNILLLLVVGLLDKDFVSDCDLTSIYGPDDFDLLLGVIKFFKKKLIITPQIVAELSNLSVNKLKGHVYHKNKYHIYLTRTIEKLKNCDERLVPLTDLLGSSFNFRMIHDIGFTDVSIIELAKLMAKRTAIITDDQGLYDRAFASKIPVIKFSHLRSVGAGA